MRISKIKNLFHKEKVHSRFGRPPALSPEEFNKEINPYKYGSYCEWLERYIDIMPLADYITFYMNCNFKHRCEYFEKLYKALQAKYVR